MSDDPKTPPGDAPPRPPSAEENKAVFGIDPALAAAMAEAEDLVTRKKAEASGDPEALIAEVGDDDDEGEEVVVEAPSRAPPMPTGAGEGVVRALAQLKETMERLEVAETEKKDFEERLLLARADLENYKKRAARELEQERKFANESLLKDLFPVMDNMERAIDATENTTLEQYAAGLEMVEKSFVDTLAKFGVEKFSALGEAFDPERMEAMQQVESTEHPPGTVVQEFGKGFLLQGRLVRPSMVVVAKAPPEATDESDDVVDSGGNEA